MAGVRSATDVGTRRCAIGLDLAAPVLEVARRGFSSTFSNQMAQLGRWSTAPDDAGAAPQPRLQLRNDLATLLAARDATAAEHNRVGLAAPGWLGWCDRHHVGRVIDPNDRYHVVWASSPVVAAFGTSLASTTPLAAEVVVAVDLDLGVSASIVSIDRTGVRELVTANAPPAWGTRTDVVPSVVADLASRARDVGLLGANRIVLVAGGPGAAAIVEQTLRALDHAWGECPVDIVHSRADIARAAVALADIESFEVVGAAPYGVGVLLDDADSGRSSVHVVVPRDAPTPVRATATFDLGPDDGADVYIDVYEEHLDLHAHPGSPERHRHRLVVTACLGDTGWTGGLGTGGGHGDGGNGRADIDLSFEIGTDGMLRLEPAHLAPGSEWSCTWAPSRLVVSSESLDDRPPLALVRDHGGSAAHQPASPLEVGGRGERTDTVSGRRRARQMAPPMGLAEALGRAERLLSRQVGRIVAVRSAMALLGSADRDDVDVLRDRADRLDRVLSLCPGDDAAHAVNDALEVARRAVEGRTGRTYVGGTVHDVSNELQRVVEHLAIVIGAVTPAERNRLVLDAQLLGLDHDRARALVDELINEAGVDSDGRPEELRDQTAVVVVSASGFRLALREVRLEHDQAAIRVLVFES